MWTLDHFPSPTVGPRRCRRNSLLVSAGTWSLMHRAAKSWNNPAGSVTNPRPWYLLTQPILNNFSFNNELLLLSLFIDVWWEWHASVKFQITSRNPLNLLKIEANIKRHYKQVTIFREAEGFIIMYLSLQITLPHWSTSSNSLLALAGRNWFQGMLEDPNLQLIICQLFFCVCFKYPTSFRISNAMQIVTCIISPLLQKCKKEKALDDHYIQWFSSGDEPRSNYPKQVTTSPAEMSWSEKDMLRTTTVEVL